MWIDSDAHFYYNANSIIDFINENKKYDFIFSQDICKTVDSINAGVFIVKNTEYSINFLKLWGYDEKLYKINPNPQWWEQGVLRYMYKMNILNIKNNCIIINYGILQHFSEIENYKKPFIIHLANQPKDIRYCHSYTYLKKMIIISLLTKFIYNSN